MSHKRKVFATILLAAMAAGGLGWHRYVAADEPLDMLSYIIGDPGTWPRTGSHPQNQVVSGNDVWFVKFGNPQAYEHWRWDDQYIYHYEDRSDGTSYHFTDGRWAKRFMSVGDVIDMPDNQIIRYDQTCNQTVQEPFHYRMVLDAHYPNYDAGGSIGMADVVVLKYDIGAANLTYELFYFAKGYGWFKWEAHYYDNLQSSTFNVIGGTPVLPANTSCVGINLGNNGIPQINSIAPNAVHPGDKLELNGSDLNNVVQFFDAAGNRTTLGGADGVTLDSQRTKVDLVVPALAAGSYTVRDYMSADNVSNDVSLVVLDSGAPLPPVVLPPELPPNPAPRDPPIIDNNPIVNWPPQPQGPQSGDPTPQVPPQPDPVVNPDPVIVSDPPSAPTDSNVLPEPDPSQQLQIDQLDVSPGRDTDNWDNGDQNPQLEN